MNTRYKIRLMRAATVLLITRRSAQLQYDPADNLMNQRMPINQSINPSIQQLLVSHIHLQGTRLRAITERIQSQRRERPTRRALA